MQEEKAESSHYIHVYNSFPAGEKLVQGSSPTQGEFVVYTSHYASNVDCLATLYSL